MVGLISVLRIQRTVSAGITEEVESSDSKGEVEALLWAHKNNITPPIKHQV